MEQLRLGASGTLRIGVAPKVPADLLPAVLGPFKQREHSRAAACGSNTWA